MYEMKKCIICGKLLRKRKYQSNLKYCAECLKISKKNSAKKRTEYVSAAEKYQSAIQKFENSTLAKDIAEANKLGISYGQYIARKAV